MIFTIYNSTTGEIHRSGSSNCEQPLFANEAILLGVYGNPKTQCVSLAGGPALTDKPEDTPSLIPIPPFVRAAQFRQWLIDNDLYGAVESAIAAIPDARQRLKTQQRWEYEPEYRREDPLVISLASAMNISSEQVDQAFREAAQYP